MLFLKVPVVSFFLFVVVLADDNLVHIIPFVNRCCAFNEYIHFDTDTGGEQMIPRCRPFKESTIDHPTKEESYNSSTDSEELTTPLYDFVQTEESGSYTNLNVSFETTGFPNCSFNPKYLSNAKDIWFQISDNKLELGLLWPFEPLWMEIPQQWYCVNEVVPYNDPNTTTTDELRNYGILFCDSDVSDYNTYLISRYFVGASDLVNVMFVLPIVVIYFILRKIQNVVGWLICSICTVSGLHFCLSGILTIVNARWIDVETTVTCVVLHMINRYLQVMLILTNFLANFHMFLTFRKMMFRVKTIDRSLDKLKIYVPVIILLPAFPTIVDQICARVYKGYSLVKETKFAYGRCSPPETKFFDHILSIMILGTLVVVLLSGCIIVNLRCSSKKLQSSSSQKQFAETSSLFLKLLLGSGAPLLFRFLVLLYLGKDDPLQWYFTATFCITGVFTTGYFFFVFGVTKSNMQKVERIIQGKPINSGTDSARGNATVAPTASTKSSTISRNSASTVC